MPEEAKAPPAPPFPFAIPALPKPGEEVLKLRTARSKSFATDKAGQYRTELYADPVHYKDANGVYQEIDASLAPSQGGVRKSKANSFVLELADDANATAVARVRLDAQVSVGFALQGAGAVKAKVDKAASTYTGVTSGVDVHLTSRADGLKEELVLASAAAGDRFVFPLELNGLTASIDSSGDVVYRDKAGAERARTPHGFMTDSAIDPRSAEAPMSQAVTYALIPNGKGTALEVRLDSAWLADPARVWPVVVDPQLTVNSSGDDTFVTSGFHADSSYSAELKVGTYDGGAHVARSFVHFDTSAINGKVVNSAQFSIGESHSWNCTSAWPVVHRVTGGWDGRTMQDWPGAPFDATSAGGVISANGACEGRTVVYDVTSAATYWAANPTQSFGLTLDTSATDNNAWKKFKSSETGAPPRLDVTWSDPPPPSTGNPFGYLDSVGTLPGGVLVQGWTIDPDTTAPIATYIYIDNNVFVEALVAQYSRPDVGAAYPQYGNNHGYYDFAPMSAGNHTVCTYGINVGGGTNVLLGCQAVTVPAAAAGEPFGSLDNVVVTPGGAQVRGWTIDPDTTAPISVQVWSDATYMGSRYANTPRPDLAPFGYGNNHGYDSFVAIPAGYHNVCTVALNTLAGYRNVLLGCRQVTVPPVAPPGAPTGAAVVASLDGSMRVTWGPSPSDGGSPLNVYGIYAYNADTTYTGLYRVECSTCTSTSFSGLTPGASYYFGVYAFNNAGKVSSPSTSATVVALANGAGSMGYFSFDSYGLTDTLSAQVNVGTGNLLISASDASVAAVGGARGVGRTYNTASLAPGASAPTSPVLGPGWRFSETPDHRLVPNMDGSVTYITPSGANPTFMGTPLVAPKGFDATLVKETDGTFTLTFPTSAEVLRFRADGLMLSDTDRNGNAITVAYPAGGGYPTTLTGTAGVTSAKTLTIAYGGPGGKLSSLSRTGDGITASVGYSYDAFGRLEKVTDAENGLTTFVYDASNRITMITDAATHVTRFAYDAAGRVASVTREVPGADAITRYDYSTPGHTKVTDPDNNPVTDYSFFADGHLDRAVNARSVITKIDWTPDLMVTKVSSGVDPNPLATLITNLFVGLNLTTATSPSGAFTETGGYGAGVTARLPGWTKDTLGAQTSYGYDAKGNLASVTDPMNGQATVTPNPDGTVWKLASPAQPTNPTVYSYTNHQLTSVTPPTGNTLAPTSSTYDGFGRLRTSVSGMGMTTTFSYDRLDRVKTEAHSDATPTISYFYDAAGNLTGQADATGTTSYVYDKANRPLTKTTPAGTLSYSWDRAGNLTTAGDPAGTTTYHYDKINRLDQVTEPGPVEATRRKDVFGYDTMGRRTDSWYNTGADVAYLGDTVIGPGSFAVHSHATYDADSQLIGLKTTRASSDADANRVSDLSYAYTVPANTPCPTTPAGRTTDIRHAVTDALTTKTTSYCYDTVGRLTSASTPGGATYAYTFDANTNRASGPEGTHSVNSGDQLTDTGFSYNADGNLTAGASLTALTYNGIGQTGSITTAGTTTGYNYAGRGQVERTTAGPTTGLQSSLGLVVETTAGVGSAYIREASGALIAERTPVGDFYYVRDGQGSVVALVDSTGTQRAAYTYDPYGDHATAAGVNGTLPPNPWRWNAGYLDASGVYKLGTRYYDSSLGRFTQKDSVDGGSANAYDYASGDPINNFDLAGTWCIGNHCIHAPKSVDKFVDKALAGCSYACITSVAITTVVGAAVTGGICGATLGAGCIAAAAGTGAAISTVKYATSKHTSDGLGCEALTGGVGGAVTGGTGNGGKALKYAGKAVAHEIGAKTPC